MKLTKRLLCVLLSLLLMLTPAVFSVGAEETAKPCPTIYVHGFMGTNLIEDKDNPGSKVIWPPDMDGILADVKDIIPDLIKALLFDQWETFGTLAINLVKPYFEPTYLAEDGTCPNNSGVYFRYPAPNAILNRDHVDFDYDWRLDPLVLASDLNDYIDYILASTGADQVNLTCHSLGGIIVLTYLSKYGNEKVKGVCFNTTAIYGETYTGDLMRGDIVLKADAVDYYLRYALEGNEYEVFLTELIGMLNKSGLLDLLALKLNALIKNQKERVCRELLLPMFGHWLTIWSMVPDQDMDDALDMVFNKLCADIDYSALREKIDAYNSDVRAGKTQTLVDLNETANVYVISRYGYSSIPVTSSYNVLSDGTVDTRYTSFGATTSNYDKTLSKQQLNGVDPKYISPDKRVNASTCLFPEQTWFIRNMKHADNPASLWSMMRLLLAQDEQATVDTFEAYPRFLVYDAQADTITPDLEVKTLSFMEKFKLFFAQLKALLSKLFNR